MGCLGDLFEVLSILPSGLIFVADVERLFEDFLDLVLLVILPCKLDTILHLFDVFGLGVRTDEDQFDIKLKSDNSFLSFL